MTESQDAMPPPPGAFRATIVLRAWFDDADAGAIVYDELKVLLTVTTPTVLRAEVEGLMWLRGGRLT